jgi:inorganic pyrophosphatase
MKTPKKLEEIWRTNAHNRANVTNSNSPDRIDPSQLRNIPRGENLLPAPIDGSVDKWFFISGAAV